MQSVRSGSVWHVWIIAITSGQLHYAKSYAYYRLELKNSFAAYGRVLEIENAKFGAIKTKNDGSSYGNCVCIICIVWQAITIKFKCVCGDSQMHEPSSVAQPSRQQHRSKQNLIDPADQSREITANRRFHSIERLLYAPTFVI